MNPNESSGASLVQRLRQEFGSEVDPGITLGDTSTMPGSSGDQMPSSPPSSGVLSRLESRAPVATRYRLDGEIARGGMGAILEVWDEDLRRNLAMKVALTTKGDGSSATPENLDARVLARFLEEAQVTGQLDHPGIVPVHELGLDEAGQLYFTMPLVRGRDLEHIFSLVPQENEGWSITRALNVLLKACEAMAYAHDKGVIHRDLKPANVMVGRFGEVYVMDWGLARVQGHEDRHDCRVAEKPESGEAPVATDPRENTTGENSEALYTMDGDVIGTPTYMAPEQARGQLDLLDERSDVYSLGAMLYRLLAQRAPFTNPGEKLGGYEILSALLDGAPAPLESLAPNVAPELIAICDKAMSRDLNARYSNMSDMADDLRAYLENRVVQAYETGAVAETRKWIRRNKPLAVSVAAGFLALVAGMVASLVLKGEADANAALAETRRISADQSAAVAQEQKAVAERQRELADEQRQVAFEQKLVAENEREKAKKSEAQALASKRAAEASEEVAKREGRINAEVNRFLNEDLLSAAGFQGQGRDVTVYQVLKQASAGIDFHFNQDPAVAARLHLTLSENLEHLGDYKLAMKHAERSLELTESKLTDDPSILVRSLRAVGSVQSVLGENKKAIETFERALVLAREVFGEDHGAISATLNNLAIIYSDLGQNEKAVELYEEVLSIELELTGKSDEYATTLGNCGLALWKLGRLGEAETALSESVELHKKHRGSKHPLTLISMVSLAQVIQSQGRLRESEKILRKALRSIPKELGEDHPQHAMALGNLGVIYIAQGRAKKAQPVLQKALGKLRKAFGEEHHETLRAKHNLATSYADQDMLNEALELREPTLIEQRRVLGDEHPDTMNSMNSLAVLYRDLERYEEAKPLYLKALELRTAKLGEDHPDTLVSLENYGGFLYTMEDYEGSIEIVRKVLAARGRVLGPDHPDVAKTTYNLGMVQMSTGKAVEAMASFEKAQAGMRVAFGDIHPLLADCLTQLGGLKVDAKEWATSIELYREAIGIRRELGSDSFEMGFMMHQIGYALYALENWSDAVDQLTEALAHRQEVSGAEDSGSLATEFMLAKSLLAVGRFEDAERLAIHYYETKLAQLGAEHRHTEMGIELLKSIETERNQ